MDKSTLIAKSREIFGDTYDFSLVKDSFLTKEKLHIICPIHGMFEKSYEKHIGSKQGCPKCSGKFRYNTETFIEECLKQKDIENITFEKVYYVNNKTKIKMFCHCKDENGNEHGEFEISPGHFLSGERCPKCRYIKSASSKRRSISEVVSEARKIHGDKYDYSLITEYKNDRIKYPIICPIHGIFEQIMNNHIQGKQGCPQCGRIKCDKNRTSTFNEFITKAKLVHGDTYEYNDENYIKSDIKIGITCKKHGVFYMTPYNHLQGQQCPKCACSHSKGEDELYDFIKTLINDDIIRHDRTVLNGEEIDILIPKYNIAFEYNGLRWHSELTKTKTYHLNKTQKCNAKSIRLFHIFEDEWNDKKDIIKSMIKNLFKQTVTKIYARKCIIRVVSSKECNDFLIRNHIQGKCNSTYKYGLYYNDELVSIMTFGKTRHFIGNKKYEYELLRFCNKINTNVIGGASKLLNFFIKTHSPKSIVSYADRRWSMGHLYEKLDFIKYNESPPNYYYIIGNKRHYRFNYRKSILKKKFNCPDDMSEHDFCFSQKWYRIYDCGCLCYVWKKEN